MKRQLGFLLFFGVSAFAGHDYPVKYNIHPQPDPPIPRDMPTGEDVCPGAQQYLNDLDKAQRVVDQNKRENMNGDMDWTMQKKEAMDKMKSEDPGIKQEGEKDSKLLDSQVPPKEMAKQANQAQEKQIKDAREQMEQQIAARRCNQKNTQATNQQKITNPVTGSTETPMGSSSSSDSSYSSRQEAPPAAPTTSSKEPDFLDAKAAQTYADSRGFQSLNR